MARVFRRWAKAARTVRKKKSWPQAGDTAILKLDVPALVDQHFQGLPPLVCANLPYNITTPVLRVLASSGRFFFACHLPQAVRQIGQFLQPQHLPPHSRGQAAGGDGAGGWGCSWPDPPAGRT